MSSRLINPPAWLIACVLIGAVAALMMPAVVSDNLYALNILRYLGSGHQDAVDSLADEIKVDASQLDARRIQRISQLRLLERSGDWTEVIHAADDLCTAFRLDGVCVAARIQAYEEAGEMLGDESISKSRLIESLDDAALTNSNSWEYSIYAESAGRAAEAMTWLKRAILIEPKSAKDWYAQGQAYGKLGRWMDAIHSLKQAQRLGFAQRDVYYSLGRMYEGQGNSGDASAAYLAAAGASSHATVGRSDALFSQGWLKVYHVTPPDDLAAVELFKKSIEINDFGNGQKGLAAAYFQLGHAYLRLGDPVNAIANYKEAIRLAPESSDYRVSLGVALIAADRGSEGLASLEEALALQPENVAALLALGDYHRTSGDALKAQDIYAHVLSIDPGNEHAIRALKQSK